MPAFWIDDAYDRAHASEGTSRYGAYVRLYRDRFAEAWHSYNDVQIGVAEFAATAWAIATSPIMAPGYVRAHRRVMIARLERSGWDGSLRAAVDLVAPWPAPLTRSRTWQRGRWWRDWPTEPTSGSQDAPQYVEPSEEDLTRAAYLMTGTSAVFTVPTDHLPALPATQPKTTELINLAKHTNIESTETARTCTSSPPGRWPNWSRPSTRSSTP